MPTPNSTLPYKELAYREPPSTLKPFTTRRSWRHWFMLVVSQFIIGLNPLNGYRTMQDLKKVLQYADRIKQG